MKAKPLATNEVSGYPNVARSVCHLKVPVVSQGKEVADMVRLGERIASDRKTPSENTPLTAE